MFVKILIEAERIMKVGLMAKFDSFFTPKRTDLIISCAGGDDADPFIREAGKTNITGEYKCGCHYEKKIKKMFSLPFSLLSASRGALE
jgi:hypothetical protein